jgi:hypothetical protein
MNSTMRQKHLCEVFHTNQGYVSYFLNIESLHKYLLTLPAAQIEWSDEVRIKSLCSLMNEKEISVFNVFGFLDGFNIPLTLSD